MKTVFFDVDTQMDFVFPAGALYVPGAENIVKTLGALTNFASSNRIQIISTVDAHNEDDPEFETWRPHCIVGTAGQQKASATIVSRPLLLSTAPNSIDAVRSQIPDSRQIVVEKQMLDCFTNSNLERLLDLLNSDRYVVYGVVTELCVQCAAFGLLRRGVRVELLSDAVKSLHASDEREMLQRFQSQGGVVTTAAAIIAQQGGASEQMSQYAARREA